MNSCHQLSQLKFYDNQLDVRDTSLENPLSLNKLISRIQFITL